MYLMCGPRQLFFQYGAEPPKGWTPLPRTRKTEKNSTAFRGELVESIQQVNHCHRNRNLMNRVAVPGKRLVVE